MIPFTIAVSLSLSIHIELLYRSRSWRFINWGVEVGGFVSRPHSPGFYIIGQNDVLTSKTCKRCILSFEIISALERGRSWGSSICSKTGSLVPTLPSCSAAKLCSRCSIFSSAFCNCCEALLSSSLQQIKNQQIASCSIECSHKIPYFPVLESHIHLDPP